MKPDLQHDGVLGELETMAKAVGEDGQDAEASHTIMAKGMVGGMMALIGVLGDLTVMAKAAKPANLKDGDDKGDDDGDNDEPNKAEGDKGSYGDDSGYEDMMKGLVNEDGNVDATQFLDELGKRVFSLEKATSQILKLMKADRQTRTSNDALVAAALQTGFATLAKGAVTTHTLLSDIPAAPAAAAGKTAAMARLAKGDDGGKYVSPDAEAVAATGLTPQLMLKATNMSLIDEKHMHLWKFTGRLSDDDAENAALIERVKNCG